MMESEKSKKYEAFAELVTAGLSVAFFLLKKAHERKVSTQKLIEDVEHEVVTTDEPPTHNETLQVSIIKGKVPKQMTK